MPFGLNGIAVIKNIIIQICVSYLLVIRPTGAAPLCLCGKIFVFAVKNSPVTWAYRPEFVGLSLPT
jgi:hypothetical protein